LTAVLLPDLDTPYRLCVTFNAIRSISAIQPIYVGYTAIEDFESLIGKVEIPPELASEENLKEIYHIAGELKQVTAIN
jgi:hypothetical protein